MMTNNNYNNNNSNNNNNEIYNNFSKNYFVGKKFRHDILGAEILKEYSVISINNILHIKIGDIYTSKQHEFEKLMRQKYNGISISQQTEVFKYLQDFAEIKEDIYTNYYIGVKNGILDLKYGVLKEANNNIVLTNKINTNYINNFMYDEYKNTTEYKLLDKTLHEIFSNNEDTITLFYEIIGYCLYPSSNLHKIFIFIGNGGNGKTVLINLINSLLGDENCSAISFEKLNERFSLVELYRKLVNIDDDATGKFLEDSSIIKKLTGDSKIHAEFKFGSQFDFYNKASIIITCNSTVKIKDTSNGISRRIILIPLKANFIGKENYFLSSQLNNDIVKECILYNAVRQFSKVLALNGKFTETEEMKLEKKHFIVSNNHILEFIEYLDEIQNREINNKTISNSIINYKVLENKYFQYKIWASENRYKILNKNTFVDKLIEQGYIKCRTTKNINWNSKKDNYILINNRPTLLLTKNEIKELSESMINVTRI